MEQSGQRANADRRKGRRESDPEDDPETLDVSARKSGGKGVNLWLWSTVVLGALFVGFLISLVVMAPTGPPRKIARIGDRLETNLEGKGRNKINRPTVLRASRGP